MVCQQPGGQLPSLQVPRLRLLSRASHASKRAAATATAAAAAATAAYASASGVHEHVSKRLHLRGMLAVV